MNGDLLLFPPGNLILNATDSKAVTGIIWQVRLHKNTQASPQRLLLNAQSDNHTSTPGDRRDDIGTFRTLNLTTEGDSS